MLRSLSGSNPGTTFSWRSRVAARSSKTQGTSSADRLTGHALPRRDSKRATCAMLSVARSSNRRRTPHGVAAARRALARRKAALCITGAG